MAVAATNPAAVPVTPYASASLYVGDLASDVTEALLFEIFNAVGPVQSVRVCRDAMTRRSLGYAYVNFHRVDDAERALDTMNFKNIRNRPCRIMWSHRDPALRRSGVGNVFVNHLDKSIDNKALYDTFSMFGNILSCKVANNDKRESLGYGFVHYESDESAKMAIERVNGKVILGSKVEVSMFKSKKERGGVNPNRFTNVFVKNLPVEFNKEQLEDLFKPFGEITSAVLNADKETKLRAFGFINYSEPEEANAAVDALNNHEIDGKRLFVGRAQKKEEREKELREKFEQIKLERQKKYAGVNLYIKNLSDEMDDARLNAEFAKFGSITSAKIMRDPQGKSLGYGFVCYSTPDEATKAVTEMNGRMIDSKPLYVALAQRKEARRAQLEAQYAARAKMGMPPSGPAGLYAGAAAPLMFQGLPPSQQAAAAAQAAAAQRQAYGMYGPQQGMLPRWNPQGSPQMVGVRPHPGMNYQLMPVNARVPMTNGVGVNTPQNGAALSGGLRGPNAMNAARPGQTAQPGQRGPRNGQAMPGGVKPGMTGPFPAGMVPGAQNIRYTENVRNRAQAPMTLPQMVQSAPEQISMPAPNEPLTIKALAAAPEEMRKQMIGERLFPLIKLQQPELAGKITGMLLEMDNGELIHLLESQQALNEKIQEALAVLQQHPGAVEDHPQEPIKAE